MVNKNYNELVIIWFKIRKVIYFKTGFSFVDTSFARTSFEYSWVRIS
jgi:hypothetical protein